MPKNKGKGGKNRKRGKNEADDEKRELVFKEDGQEYAQVLRMLGNGRCEAMCIDGTKRLCHIRGKMHKKVWIAAGDIVLVGLPSLRAAYTLPSSNPTWVYMGWNSRYNRGSAQSPITLYCTGLVQDDKADVILKYMPDEARLLKAYGELPENTRLNEGIANLDEEDENAADDYIEFEDEDIDKI
ncbi:hypothetical protein KY290_002351 [Solanum tuberosum]|uniref:Eukaryotic translation initiation factor 4C n=1 Tax=Solanum tuberosum TaxID=4113 RepID=A0ABQ7WPT1_SOLTU|nr:hypothetical protein KY285_002247 [Solanum tuberosum]KAH0782753.1 hypothetical protein KY290_002351 [Solanum tuberosum]